MVPAPKPWNVVALVTALLLALPMFGASDAVTVGTVTASGPTVDVPVFIRDVAGTSLGMDRPTGSRIQSFSIKVDYAPASAVQSISFSRAGITANLTPTSEFKPTGSGSVSLLDIFQESTNAIPFSLNASAPGNLVAHLVITLSASAAPGSSITLTLDPALTQLTDAGGTAATKETVANGGLALVNGRIDVPPLSVTLSPAARKIIRGETGKLTATLNAVVGSETTVSLVSSAPAIAGVPASIVVPAGMKSATINVAAHLAGTAKITATLNNSSSSAMITVAEPEPPPPPECPTPAAPVITVSADAEIGVPYNVTWNAVTGATEYEIGEATGASFSDVAVQTVNGTSAAFTHDTGGATYFYRVRARAHTDACDTISAFSSSVSVHINQAPVPARRILPVVGSVPGNFNSYFRTSVQLYNPRTVAVSGTILFHPAGAQGSDADPSMPYVIEPGQTRAFDDLLPAMGLESGLGSVDLIADATSPLPLAVARVFNDGGLSGTTGLTEEALSPDDALRGGNAGVLFAPENVQRFRLNVGIRTLDQGVAFAITVRDRDGISIKTLTRTFPPTYFTQISSASLLNGHVLAGGETVTFDVTGGSAFIYGATTDNTTNDPSVQFARRIE